MIMRPPCSAAPSLLSPRLTDTSHSALTRSVFESQLVYYSVVSEDASSWLSTRILDSFYLKLNSQTVDPHPEGVYKAQASAETLSSPAPSL